jgi:hypothetical protein
MNAAQGSSSLRPLSPTHPHQHVISSPVNQSVSHPAPKMIFPDKKQGMKEEWQFSDLWIWLQWNDSFTFQRIGEI